MKKKNSGANRPKRIFLADQQALMRLAAAVWLEQTPGLTVCGQADSPATALAAITKSRPDMVVTEIFCPEDMRFIQELHKRHPDLPILVYSNGNEKWYAPRALEAGADGYVLKGVDADGLIDAIQRTLEGRVVLSKNMRYRLLVKCLPRKRPCRLHGGERWQPANCVHPREQGLPATHHISPRQTVQPKLK